MTKVFGLGGALPSRRQDRNEQILLAVVEKEVRDRTQQSLHDAILQTLGQPDAFLPVALPRRGTLRWPDGRQQSLSPETSIYNLFALPTVNGRLQISGPVGIGKTTALLELAAELVRQATHDPEHPLPVLFHLSSWPVEQQSFEDWLRAELQLKYGVSPKLSNQWLQANFLLPLLDGLDELPADCQVSASQHINDWLSLEQGPLVVCCQPKNSHCAPLTLALNATLDLAPLTPEQLKKYLHSLDLDALWLKLPKSPDYPDLICKPLGLSLLILTKDTLNFDRLKELKTSQDLHNWLLDGFILQQLHRTTAPSQGASGKQPTAQQIRLWLGWLARHVQTQPEHEFLIEKMQPTLLSNRRQVMLYSLLGGLIFGAIGGTIFGLLVGPFSGVFVASIVAFMFIIRRGDDPINTLEEVKPTFSTLMKFVSVRQIGPIAFFMVLLAVVIYLSAGDPGVVVFALVIGLLMGLLIRFIYLIPSWLIGGLVIGLNRLLEGDITVQNQPNHHLFATLRYALRVAALFVPIGLVIKISPPFWDSLSGERTVMDGAALSDLLGVGAALALWAAIFDSALVCAQHLALRLVLCRAKAIPWNYARFLNGCCDRYLLQRVGSRYQFIHRLVQERLATM
jgi:DNA polymerase III delta prime subunit